MRYLPIFFIIYFIASCDEAGPSSTVERYWPTIDVFDAPVIELQYAALKSDSKGKPSQRRTSQNSRNIEIPKVRLDLRVPQELLDGLTYQREQRNDRLLPELVDKPADKTFQIDAQFLYRDRELDISQPLDGALLEFKIRQ